MARIRLNTATRVIPQCYAYTTPGVPRHDGEAKIGFTEKGGYWKTVPKRI